MRIRHAITDNRDRAYRNGLSEEKIISELERCAGSQLDKRVTDLFIRLIKSGEIAKFAKEEPFYPD